MRYQPSRFLSRALICCGLLSGLALGSPAYAQDCSASSVTAQQVGVDDYDPGDVAQAVVRLSVRLSDDCTPRSVEIRPRDTVQFELPGPSQALRLRQSDASETIAPTPSTTSLAQQSLQSLANSKEITFDFFDIDPGQFVIPGIYQTAINVFVDGELSSTEQIILRVSPILQLIGDAANGNIVMDLGDLSAGPNAQQSIYFRTNARVSLMITSDHGGAMQHELGSSYGSIPYDATINGIPVNPSSSPAIDITAVPGANLNQTIFGVSVPPAQDNYAGRYTDVLTFNFTAN